MFEHFRFLHLIRFAKLSFITMTLHLIKLRVRSDEVLIQQDILIMVYFPLRCYKYMPVLTWAGVRSNSSF